MYNGVSKMPNILIVDDDIHISNLLAEALQNNGYTVQKAFSGTEALLVLSNKKPDLILLDLMLPGISGEEVLSGIKNIPVIVLSAKASVSDKVELLLAGAVDYMTKPFDIDELLARIAVQLRTKNNLQEASVMTFDEITLNTDTHIVEVGTKEVKLTRTEYAILKLLMQNPQKVVAKLTILEKIFYDTPDCTEDSLKIHIHNLRKKLKAVSGKDYIEAVWGIGFMLKS